MESRVYAPTAVVVADDYRGVQLRITNMDSHRGSAADDSLEISNLKPFSLTVSVTRNGAPFACVLQLCLVTDDDQAIPPFLTEEDRRFPLLLGHDKAPTEAPPVDVPDTGVAVVKLQLGLKALSSKAPPLTAAPAPLAAPREGSEKVRGPPLRSRGRSTTAASSCSSRSTCRQRRSRRART